MPKWSLQVVFLLLLAAPCVSQGPPPPPADLRPFGKYLVQVCTLRGEPRTLTCAGVPLPLPGAIPANLDWPALNAMPQLKDQTITLKLVCNPDSKALCDLKNPTVGDEFYVSATADSGIPVRQTVLVGGAVPLGGQSTVHYRANAEGPIVIRATAPGTPLYAAAAPVDLILQASGESTSSSNSCPVLPPTAAVGSSTLDAPTIVSLLGNPTPFILAAQGPNTIVVYTTRQPLLPNERRILGSFQQAISELAGHTAASLGITPTAAKPFSVELRIPHGSALGDLATRIAGPTTASSRCRMWEEAGFG
jgi:hypothetical protein